MWLVIGVLAVIGVLWVKFCNRDGGNSPQDWVEDIRHELTDDTRETTRTARDHLADYWNGEG